jgi:hypothetical protein
MSTRQQRHLGAVGRTMARYRPKLRNLGEVGTVLFQISRRDEIVSIEIRQLTYNSPALLR